LAQVQIQIALAHGGFLQWFLLSADHLESVSNMAGEELLQARDLTHSSLTPYVEPEWHTFFASSESPLCTARYLDLSNGIQGGAMARPDGNGNQLVIEAQFKEGSVQNAVHDNLFQSENEALAESSSSSECLGYFKHASGAYYTLQAGAHSYGPGMPPFVQWVKLKQPSIRSSSSTSSLRQQAPSNPKAGSSSSTSSLQMQFSTEALQAEGLDERCESRVPEERGLLSARQNSRGREDKSAQTPAYSEVQLAGAKLARGLLHTEHVNIHIESNSVYGAAVLMPQLARSTGWNCHLTSLAISSYAYLLLCIFVHGCMLMFMAKEERIMDGFAGQMYLCDFGENTDRCSGPGTECIGPGGTKMTPARLYSWTQWTTRVYVKQSIESAFPSLKDVIDPGEYGVESYNCRLVCVILFVMSIVPEMELCVDMVKLLWYVPTEAQPWIQLADKSQTPETAEESMEKIKVHVAGMSGGWKVFNFWTILVPKLLLVFFTAQTGICFLMETAGIEDIIVNSVALGFLLSLDELITDNLMSAGANQLIDICEGYSLLEEDEEEFEEAEIVYRYKNMSGRNYYRHLIWDMCRTQLIKFFAVGVVTAVFVIEYYWSHCDWKDGRYVSKTIHLPAGMSFNFWNAFFPWFAPVTMEKEPYWTMPAPP